MTDCCVLDLERILLVNAHKTKLVSMEVVQELPPLRALVNICHLHDSKQ